MADKTKCARCGKTLSEAEQAAGDKMPLCDDCRGAATVKAPPFGSD
jgi:DNA-directed RNA polymerase subunit RPC12/RpoP